MRNGDYCLEKALRILGFELAKIKDVPIYYNFFRNRKYTLENWCGFY